ncbi:MAG: S-layer homology domain-containing protein [Oscillospiraceae bacterium]|nr:S-layer homology domain-containing protein [Oscillospiraceae bacterium]
MYNINKPHSLSFKKFLVLVIGLFIVISYSASVYSEVSAKQITGTGNDGYRKNLESKYDCSIIIDDSVLQKNAFYTSPRNPEDIELQVLKDIDSAFAMLPDGFVKEINDYLNSSGYNTSLNIGKVSAGNDSAGCYDEHGGICVYGEGNDCIETLLHEFGHEIAFVLQLKNKLSDIQKYFTDLSDASKYPYNVDFNRLNNINLGAEYYDIYLSVYSSRNFDEDFAETFLYAVTQPRYISSYGDGVKKPIHNKIEMISQVLTGSFSSLKDAKFLLNCLPDAPAQWAAESVKKAKESGIIPWNTYGLNTCDLTRYDAALILQPFLYKYVSEDVLLKQAGINKNDPVQENFVYDITDGTDILLLNNLKIISVDSSGHFNPNGKIQKQAAAAVCTIVAQLFGISDTNNADLKFNDLTSIADWAKPYVKFAVSMKIMDGDDKNNFNPERYITYQEFYGALLNISNLKEEYNKKNNIKLPETGYYKVLGNGTILSSDGWMYYYNYYDIHKYTGKCLMTVNKNGSWYEGDLINGIKDGNGKYVYSDGRVYIGEWKNDVIEGNGKMTWPDGEWFDGEWQNGNPVNGNGQHTFDADSYFQGEWKNGNVWNGTGKMTSENGSWFEGEWKNGLFWTGTGKMVYSNGAWFEGEWKNGVNWNGKGKIISSDGSWFEGELKNGAVWNGNGTTYVNGKLCSFKCVNGISTLT